MTYRLGFFIILMVVVSGVMDTYIPPSLHVFKMMINLILASIFFIIVFNTKDES